MPSLTFRPIEANLTHNTDLIGRMNPYCVFIVGSEKYKGEICHKGGKHPTWIDVVTVPMVTNVSMVAVELWDKDKITHDDIIGTTTIDLRDIETLGKSSRWYPLFYKNKPAGEILIETTLQGAGLSGASTGGLASGVGLGTGEYASGTGYASEMATGAGVAGGVAGGSALAGGLASGAGMTTSGGLTSGAGMTGTSGGVTGITYVFRPIEARLTHKTDLIMKMSPYVAFVAGNERIMGPVCPKGNKTPIWQCEIAVPLINNASCILVEVMDKDKVTADDLIGSCTIDLREFQAAGGLRKSYPLTYKGRPAGELLLEGFIWGSNYASNAYSSGLYGTGYNYESGRAYVGGQLWEGSWDLNQQADFFSRYRSESQQSHFYTEQRQFVENRTFLKEVDVVETVPVQKTIEVLEPHMVVREVQYTQAVPVTKQIEVVEPVVVQKEVEVIEPRVVTKCIQVVENVPVMKRVEVVELQSHVENVQTLEPQTFTKQVELTEQVPTLRNVTVTEPVTVKKSVEFVEPVITTQTITKEVVQPIVVDQRITTEVGPATLVGIHTDIHREFAHLSLAERERLIEQQNQLKLQSGYQAGGVQTDITRTTYTSTTTGAAGGATTAGMTSTNQYPPA